jgi:hypothetical protein
MAVRIQEKVVQVYSAGADAPGGTNMVRIGKMTHTTGAMHRFVDWATGRNPACGTITGPM